VRGSATTGARGASGVVSSGANSASVGGIVASASPTGVTISAGTSSATVAPALSELAPLLTAPEAPRAPALAVPLPDAPQAAAGAAGAAATRTAQALTVGSAALGGPPMFADPVPAALAAAAGSGPLADSPLRAGFLGLDPSRATAAPGADADGRRSSDPMTAAFAAEATAEIQAPQLVSPSGPAPAQSLLAVLASYILPGSGPVPAGTIFLLVMVGVLLVAAYAPRLAGSERIWLSGLLGPRSGHGLAVRRPG